ncbi:MAG TPA: hypothetical protein VD865_17780 [Stenotrophomonas sp.]|nr:hypothetical protein [Stenotrophomonas sp.]
MQTARPPLLRLLVLLLCLAWLPAAAEDAAPPAREMRFTGPLVASGTPLPQGMLIVEPYLVQTQVSGRYDDAGKRRAVRGAADDWRVVTPVIYGLTPRLTLTATLRGINAITTDSGRRWATGDTTLGAQYLLYRGTSPARATVGAGVRQNMPSGRHDQLDRYGLADATGSGAAFTMLALYGQAFVLPERNLRLRANLFYRLPGAGFSVRGRSGYGSLPDFRGRAHLGGAWQGVLSAEYSFSPRWVLAGDVMYEREQGTRVHRFAQPGAAGTQNDLQRAGSWRLSLAPALEYHPSPKLGILGGALVSLDGRNSAALFSPQMAVMMVF